MSKHYAYVLADYTLSDDRLQQRFSDTLPAQTVFISLPDEDQLIAHVQNHAQTDCSYTLIAPHSLRSLGSRFADELDKQGCTFEQAIIHSSELIIAQQEAQVFHDRFPHIPCHVAETDGQGVCATYSTRPQGDVKPHEPRQRTYILEDHQYKYNDLITYHRDAFPDGQLLMFNSSESLTAHLQANFDPQDRYVLIADGAIGHSLMPSIEAVNMFFSTIEAGGGKVAAAYLCSGLSDYSHDIQNSVEPQYRKRLEIVNDEMTFTKEFSRIFGRWLPEGAIQPMSRGDYQKLESAMQQLEEELAQMTRIEVTPATGTPAIAFKEASGIPVTGLLAYTAADIAANTAEGSRSILITDKLGDDVLAALTSGQISGVICQQVVLAGHDPVQIEAFGASALVGAPEDALLSPALHAAGQVVTLDPPHKTLWLGPASIFNALADDPEVLARAKSLRNRYFNAQMDYGSIANIEINASSLQALETAKEMKMDVGLLRSEHFCINTADAKAEMRQLLRGEGDEAVLLNNFADRTETLVRQLWPYRQMHINLRLLDIKPEEYLPAAEAAEIRTSEHLPALMDKLHHIQMRSYIRQLLTGEIPEEELAHWTKGRPNIRLMAFAPNGLTDLEKAQETYTAVRDACVAEVNDKDSIAVRLEEWSQFYTPRALGVMLETPRACEDISEFEYKTAHICIGTNDLTENVLGLSRQDAAARVSMAQSSGQGADPFQLLYPEVASVLKAAFNQVDNGSRITLCGMQMANPKSIAALDGFSLSISLSPTMHNLFVMPTQNMLEGGRRRLQLAKLRPSTAPQAA